MQIFTETRGRTFKRVSYILDKTDVTDREVYIAALEHFNETPSSIFGKRVTRTGSVVTVELYTD